MLLACCINLFQFTFASSTVVTVYFREWSGFHNVYITPSAADYQQSEGLCGHIVESRKSVHALRDGSNAASTKAFMANWWVFLS